MTAFIGRRDFITLLGGAAAWPMAASAQDRPARILYFTHSAGYRHDVIPASHNVLQRIGATAGFEITASENVTVFTMDNLRRCGAIMFFTSGELPMSNAQQVAFMDFLRAGGGFLGGALGDRHVLPVAGISPSHWRVF